MQSGHGRESFGCVELGFSKENCSVQLSWGADVCRGDNCLGWHWKFYDDLVDVVNSHATKMPVTPLDPPPP